MSPELRKVLDSAARLQKLVSDAVLVGGTVVALYAGHRQSYDHDRVLRELNTRFDTVLEALEREGDFALNRVVPGKIILGELGGIQTGIRQLIRAHSLETQRVDIGNEHVVTIPTQAETIRIKAYLILKRNQVRDYLDVAALSAHLGTNRAAHILALIDNYYSDASTVHDFPVRAQLVRQLTDPHPADSRVISDLAHYKGLKAPWKDWDAFRQQTEALATAIETAGGGT